MLRVPIDPRAIVIPGNAYPYFAYTSAVEFIYRITAMDGTSAR